MTNTTTFTTTTNSGLEIEVDHTNPLHQIRMSLAMELDTARKSMATNIERLADLAAWNQRNLDQGSQWFDSASNVAATMDELATKISEKFEALKKMDWAIERAAGLRD